MTDGTWRVIKEHPFYEMSSSGKVRNRKTKKIFKPEHERWKNIPGLKKYQASDKGRIRRRSGNSMSIVKLSSEFPGRKSFLSFVAYSDEDKEKKKRYVHQVVARTFFKEKYEFEKHNVKHKNGIRTDNFIENLELININNETHKLRKELNKNRKDKRKNERNVSRTNERVAQHKKGTA